MDADGLYCTYSCTGDPGDTCGGVGGYISIYYDATRYTPSNTSTTPAGPVTVNSTGNYDYIGCWSEGTGGRALQGLAPPAPINGFDVEICETACEGYTYFGVEFANQCYCGNALMDGSTLQTSTDPATNGCNMICTGNTTEYCGGPNRLNVYQANSSAPIPSGSPTAPAGGGGSVPTGGPQVQQTSGPYVYFGCYIDNTNGRALSSLENPESGPLNTVDACAAACVGYTYMGVEYGDECYCANAIGGGNGLAPGGNVPANNGCNMVSFLSLMCCGPQLLM